MKDGGPAFPLCRTEADGRNDCLSMGMSLRDWFAGMALPAVVRIQADCGITIEEAAYESYMWADAMIAERDKESK